MKEGKANITVDEIKEVSEAIGYGAVKYYDLHHNPISNYKFSYEQMLLTVGDTAVYLLYAHVRLESIVAKAAAEQKIDIEDSLKASKAADQSVLRVEHPAERNLALKIANATIYRYYGNDLEWFGSMSHFL